jgi:hypothetical protein
MKKHIVDGKVAVLYSPGYGAGWSTWGDCDSEQVMFDPSIVYMVQEMNKAADESNVSLFESWVSNIEEYCKDKYPDLYLGGVKDLDIAWISEGTYFRIDEHDGSESIEYKENDEWIIA